MQNIEHVMRFYQHAVGLRSDDVTPRAFVLHELSNLGLNFFHPPPQMENVFNSFQFWDSLNL